MKSDVAGCGEGLEAGGRERKEKLCNRSGMEGRIMA